MTVLYRVVGPPTPVAGRCPVDATPGPPPRINGEPTAGRFTYRDAETGALVCDVVIPADAEAPVVGVPEHDGGVDVWVELFDGETLLATGVARDVDLTAGGTVTILATARGHFACGPARLRIPRAFHTATRLPDGRLLVIGGAVADPDGATDVVGTAGLYATASVEVYDPRTERAVEVTVPGLRPRAFHGVAVLSESDEAVTLALVGGLTVADTEQPVVTFGGPYRLAPAAGAVAAPTEVVTVELATTDIAATAVDPGADVAPRMFAAHLGRGGAAPAIVAGGLGSDGMTPQATFEVLASDGTASASAATREARVGATLTWVADDEALLWGGFLATVVDPMDQAGELLGGLDGAMPGAAAISYAVPTDTPALRAFHGAAQLGDGSVVVVGGFDASVAAGADPVPQARFAERITLAPTAGVSAMAVLGGGAATPAAFADVTVLPDGDALVSGGNPALGFGACATERAGLACSISASYRARAGEPTLEPAGTGMVVARYGHRATLQPDGTLLVTGGLGLVPSGELAAIAELEVYDPREEDDDPLADLLDAELTRAPGDVARAADGEPAAPCALIETGEPAQ